MTELSKIKPITPAELRSMITFRLHMALDICNGAIADVAADTKKQSKHHKIDYLHKYREGINAEIKRRDNPNDNPN